GTVLRGEIVAAHLLERRHWQRRRSLGNLAPALLDRVNATDQKLPGVLCKLANGVEAGLLQAVVHDISKTHIPLPSTGQLEAKNPAAVFVLIDREVKITSIGVKPLAQLRHVGNRQFVKRSCVHDLPSRENACNPSLHPS